MNVLFICSGNTCRSPMAEVIAAAMYTNHSFSSAGTATLNGLPASRGAQNAVRLMGLSLNNHVSRALTRQLIVDSDIVLCMTPSHAAAANMLFSSPKITTLSAAANMPGAVNDPYGLGDAEYYEIAIQIKSLLEKCDFLKNK